MATFIRPFYRGLRGYAFRLGSSGFPHLKLQITGYREDEVLGQHQRILSSDRQDDGFYEAMGHVLQTTGHWQGEIWNRRKNGELYAEWLSMAAVTDGAGRIVHFVGVFSDVTRRKRDEERIRYQTNFDVLTGLVNRWQFQGRLEEAVDRARREGGRVGVLVVDIDHFKFINDSLGHGSGDALLKEVGQRLTGCVREHDIVARIGGDEFALIVSERRDQDQVNMIAKRVLAALGERFHVKESEVVISACVGIAMFPVHAETADDLVKNAATAMTHAKEQGRHTLQFYSDDMSTRAIERFQLEASLRRALEQDEFELHFQPQVDLASWRIVGAEALIRWRTHGQLVGPGEFIAEAEASGLIVPIGDWVLRAVCRQIVAWQAAGIAPPRIGINLSFKQFRKPDFLAGVKRTLAEAAVDANGLQFELTESLVMHDADAVINLLEELRRIGIELAIDDFGTGYSSLNRLKRLPVSILKIDRSFVSEVTTDQGDAEIASAIIAMAHSLNLRVVAEGVETEAQLAFMRNHGCDVIQGYHVSRPLAADAFTEFLLGWGRKHGPRLISVKGTAA